MNTQIGYLKYTGNSVKDGVIDARKASQALSGLDEALRGCISIQNPDLIFSDCEFSVLIQKGSWTLWLQGITGVVTTIGLGSYVKTAAEQLAKNDFKDIKTTDILKGGLRGLYWVVKIAKHIGEMGRGKFHDINKWIEDNKKIELENSQGEILIVPLEYLYLYTKCPKPLLMKLGGIIDQERELEIAYFDNNEELNHPALKVRGFGERAESPSTISASTPV